MDNKNLKTDQECGCGGCGCDKEPGQGGYKSNKIVSIIIVIVLIGIIAVGMFFTKKGEENAAIDAVKTETNSAVPPQTNENGAIIDTLKVVGDHLEGETDAIGYLVVKKQELFGEMTNSAFFALSGKTSPVLTDWIDSKVKSGNSINLIDGYHMLGIGCDAGTKISSPWMKEVAGEEYTKLKAASEASPITVKMIFVDPPDAGGACLSYVKEMKF
ncbi:MAG: hypothetical protein UT33_C0012G0053 [Candidatus Peregrinibacteria bacterium GW2011_GWC2_39_14]|nr:MAG: hypothetical protein US92_C0003G0080 [Candidatus Peregrinibacteria bacterium GW2011_GWA2_38_36]KKR05248.1 MAG: hypothetical protein UT33_C0012G0053 [Candidatus Peregrinibacteria bacterium GW2011_GWC2_39_14]